MSIDERVLSVVQALYDAAMDETLWPGALRELVDFTGSQAATFWVLDGSDQPRLPTLTVLNFDPKFQESYQKDGMVPLDPTVQYLVRHPHAPIVHDGLVITEREKDRSAYYDWHSSWSDTRFRMVGQVRPAPAVQAGVALHRTRQAGRYEAPDIERFAIAHPHLERALSIGFRLGGLGAMQQCTMELLDRNPAAILLLDNNKRVVYSNRPAEELLAAQDGISYTARGGLAALRKQDNDKLQTIISRALSGTASTDSMHGGALRLHRLSRKRPYGVFVASLSGKYPLLSALRPAVCIMIVDPVRQPGLPADRLKAIFSLTDAEARLAVRLVEGDDLRSAAASLKITYGTARARLVQIFQKTETRRQGELIKLLLTTLAQS